MLRELLSLVPECMSNCSLNVAIGGAVLGVTFWLIGARFSRSLVTLIGVAIGTSVGMRVPGWLGWSIDGMALGVGGAVLLGVSGYLLHRTWIGIYLSSLLALWALAGSWIVFYRSQMAISLSVDWKTGIVNAFESMWNQLPTTLAHTLAIAATAALLVGMVMTFFWPRLSRITTWSLAGVSLIVAMLGIAQQRTHSNWVGAIKLSDLFQIAALFGLVLLGALIQWSLSPRAHRAVPTMTQLPMDD